MLKITLQEIAAIWDKIGDIGRKQSDFTDTKTAEVKAISGNVWNPTKVYMDGNTIIYGGSFARCLHANKGIEPTNKVYWELVTVSDMILELMERVSALEQEE